MKTHNINNDLKRPTELIEMYPNCEWTPQQIGYLLMLGMVRGVKTPQTCLIYVTSFEAALFHKRNVNGSVIQLSPVTKK